MNEKTYNITQLINYIKNQLSNDFLLQNISVTGELGNYTKHFSGHWYFSLKDDKSLINCAMFKGYNIAVEDELKNGDIVEAKGYVNVFEKSGQLQLVITSMKLAGAGDFYQQFEKMKQKLAPLGYFDENRKKPIPKYTNKIAVITGANTAALQDIKITVAKRWPIAQIIEVNALVQGQQAVESIVKAIKQADQLECDVIILARGGGSVDDLFCFNDEKIAQAIYECRCPLVTGIGHEIDTTIADLVADKRCATPTAAASAVTADINEEKEKIYKYSQIIQTTFTRQLNASNQQLDYFNSKLLSYQNNIDNKIEHLRNISNIMAVKISNRIDLARSAIDNNTYQLNTSLSKLKCDKENALNILINKLDNLSPLKTMARGYILSSQDDKIIKSVKDVQENKDISLRYYDGKITVRKV